MIYSWFFISQSTGQAIISLDQRDCLVKIGQFINLFHACLARGQYLGYLYRFQNVWWKKPKKLKEWRWVSDWWLGSVSKVVWDLLSYFLLAEMDINARLYSDMFVISLRKPVKFPTIELEDLSLYTVCLGKLASVRGQSQYYEILDPV